jgi:outer membrane protein TolC
MAYDLRPGLPSQLLFNRPDVVQAELNFRTAFENTNVARTAFYPQLRITAAAGVSAFKPKDLFTSAGIFGNIAAGLTQPIFNKGQNKADLLVARSRQQMAVYEFQAAFNKAGKEVADALSAFVTAESKEIKRGQQLQALSKAVEFNKELLINSKNVNYTDVLAAEQNLLNAQFRAINDKGQKLHAIINIYRALGGGWK